MKNRTKIFIALLAALPIAMGITGCSSGGVNGEGNSSYESSTTSAVRSNVYNDTGWEYISKGQYDSAIKYFNDVLAASPTEGEKAEANNGIGWAKAHNGKLKDGMKWFQLASDLNNDAKVGLAAAYIQEGSLSDLEEVINLLYIQLGNSKPNFTYTPGRATGVSNAEVHAMLGYAFSATGDKEKADEQLNYAKELQPNYAGTRIAQLISVIEFLNN